MGARPAGAAGRALKDAFPDDCARRFERRERLGEGGFGAVFRAVHRGLGSPAAVKVLTARATEDSEQVRRFEAEARATAAIEHPSIVRVLDHGAECGVPWIAFELVPGRTVRELVDEGALDPALACEVARQVADALAAAHEKGIVHRDIKPDNVLRTEGGACKVADLGIARWSGSGVKTATGVVLGTPVYVAPECVRGEAAGPASDVYALGVMLFEMLAGEPPYRDESPVLVLERHLSSPVPSLCERSSVLPRSLDALVARLLAKEPAERGTAADARDALAAWLEGRAIVEPAPPRPAGARAGAAGTGAVSDTRAVSRAGASGSATVSRPDPRTAATRPVVSPPGAASGAIALGVAAVALCAVAAIALRSAPALPPPPRPPVASPPPAAPSPSSKERLAAWTADAEAFERRMETVPLDPRPGAKGARGEAAPGGLGVPGVQRQRARALRAPARRRHPGRRGRGLARHRDRAALALTARTRPALEGGARHRGARLEGAREGGRHLTDPGAASARARGP